MSIEYPVKITIEPYFGNSEKLRHEFIIKNQIVKRIEEYINSKMKGNISKMFAYTIVASELGLSTSEVHNILMLVGGGNHGITVTNPNQENNLQQ